MKNQVVEFSGTAYFLSLFRGFLLVKKDEQEKKIVLDDLHAIVLSGYGNSISTNLISECQHRGIQLILCDSKFMPETYLWPYSANYKSYEKLCFQMLLKKPLKKQLWQSIIKAKILNQYLFLKKINKEESKLKKFSEEVLSGDSSNLEAQAARIYWKSLFGKDFIRNQDFSGINSLLNYTYAILRSMVARSIAGAGLNPSLSLFHNNKENPFGLVDDILEPYRPFVDSLVYEIVKSLKKVELNSAIKKDLVLILNLKLKFLNETVDLSTAVKKTIKFLVDSYEYKKNYIKYPLF